MYIMLASLYQNAKKTLVLRHLLTIMIHEFVEKIVVHAKENQYVQSSPQQIEIHPNFIGECDFLNTDHEPTPEEMRIERVREYDRQRYQKRKAAGYYDKPKKKPKKTERTATDLLMAANQ